MTGASSGMPVSRRRGFLALILVFAGLLQFPGRDWDARQLLHPDERFLTMVVKAERWPDSVAEYFDEARSPLNPRNVGFPSFAYGTLPTTLLTGIASATDTTEAAPLAHLGRTLSAFASLLTVWVVFLLGRRLYSDERVALLAALLFASSVLVVQHAHFFVVDPFATLCVTTAAWALAGPAGARRFLVAGAWFGLALACKISVASFALVIAAVAIVESWHTPSPGVSPRIRPAASIALAGLAMLVTFRIAQPDAFANGGFWPASRWLRDLWLSVTLANGTADAPPSLQWANRVRYGFAWWNLVVWGLGPALGLSAWAAWGVATVTTVRRPASRHLIPVLWTGLLFAHLGGQFVMTTRYLLPIYPMLALLAAWGLVQLWHAGVAWDARHGGRRRQRVAAGVGLSVTVVTALWAIAFTAIYRQPHTRVEASRWIYANVPPGATLATEHWDDALPLALGESTSRVYPMLTLTLYDGDTPQKLEGLLSQLDQADYVVLSSQRLSDSIPRMPMRYPMTTRYYEALLAGRLGFSQVSEFTSYPRIGPLHIGDHNAEESLSVYDHPRVRIFRKDDTWSVAGARALLGTVDWDAIIDLPAVSARRIGRGAMLDPAERVAVRDGGTWTRMFDAPGFASRWPLVTWALLLAGLGLVAFPLVRPALVALPDEGWLLARTAGLLVFGYAIWLPASLRWLPATPETTVGVAIGLVLLSAVMAWRQRLELGRVWREKRALLIGGDAIFWTCFFAFVLIRRMNPDLWHPHFGGEKPMDVAYLLATIRSEAYPPYDPWFAGGSLNYYYFGFVLTAALTKLSGVLPEVAYNLAVPTFFALAASAVFAVVHALVTALGISRRHAVGLGVAGLIFAVVLGNLKQAALVVTNLRHGSFGTEPVSTWFWAATRAIPAGPGEGEPITEFPFFTYLYGDLHAHAMALPVTLLVLALATSLVLSHDSPPRVPMLSWPRLAWLALALGALFPLNAWDYPTYAVVVGICFALRAWLEPAAGRGVPALAVAMAGTAIVFGAGRVLFWPFYSHFAQAYGSFSFWRGTHTGLVPYLQVHGLFLFLIASAACLLMFERRRRGSSAEPAAPLLLVGLLTLLAVTLTLAVELVVLDGDISRMNTVFKFYFQAWVLLSICAATSLAVIVRAWQRRPAPLPARTAVVALTWSTVACWLTVAAATYPVLATWARAVDRMSPRTGRTLDGLAFMETAHYEQGGVVFPLAPDLAAIRWLRANVSGTPVVAEAHLPEYRWGARVSVHTGLPTIIGWRHHQAQQRGLVAGGAIARRIRDVATLYGTTEAAEALTIARRHQVEYIYVGPLERIVYPSEGLAKFDRPLPDWRLVYDADSVRIYHVPPPTAVASRR